MHKLAEHSVGEQLERPVGNTSSDVHTTGCRVLPRATEPSSNTTLVQVCTDPKLEQQQVCTDPKLKQQQQHRKRPRGSMHGTEREEQQHEQQHQRPIGSRNGEQATGSGVPGEHLPDL